MDKNENIEKRIGEAMSSLDGAGRAEPRPFLFTRINARMNRQPETIWERAGQWVSRPAFILAGLALLIGINAMVVLLSPRNEQESTAVSEQVQNGPDDYANTVATLYDIENTVTK